jgi:hypothetical protein
VDFAVAISTKRDEIFAYVVTQQASRTNVVDLETIGATAVLASPTIPLSRYSCSPGESQRRAAFYNLRRSEALPPHLKIRRAKVIVNSLNCCSAVTSPES